MCNVGGTIVSEQPFSQGRLPVIVAHRGAPTERPENTLAAFEAAIAAGAGAVEFDVRLTADGRPVVLHDATLDRTTDRDAPESQNAQCRGHCFDDGSQA